MAGAFVIEELRYDRQQQKYVPAANGDRFEWTPVARTSPINGWPYEVVLRTVRDDYVGADEPTEQVLGAHYEPFKLSGKFDDRYAGQGFAARESDRLEKMIRRGPVARVSYGALSFVGLLRRLTVTYQRPWLCTYEFEVSPHRKEDGTPPRTLDAKKIAPVRDYATQVLQYAQALADLHERAPVRYIKGLIHSTVSGLVSKTIAKAEQVSAVVEGRVLSFDDEVTNGVAKVVSDLEALRQAAIAIRTELASAKTTTDLFFYASLIALEYDAWSKGIGAIARAMAVLAREAAQELRRRVSPDAQALYRPRAGESLYDVANKFYGSPADWRRIAERNGLDSMELNGTELLIIPTRT